MWNQTYEIDRNQKANSIIETSDGGYAIAGGYGVIEDFCLLKIDEWGNMQWFRTYGGEETDWAFSLVETSDGGYALAGRTESFGQGEEDFWLVKTDANGNMQWNRTYGGPDPETAYSLIETSDGGYALAGWIISFFTGKVVIWVAKADMQGNIPEFPAWTPMLIMLFVILVVAVIYKRKLSQTPAN